MDFIYFLAFWGIFLTVCGMIVLLTPNHNTGTEEL